MQAQLLKYSDKCFLTLANNLYRVADGFNIEFVHALRLCVKKIHTLLKVIDYSDNCKKDSKILKKIDRVFFHSGNLRDIQVQILILKLYKNKKGVEIGYLIKHLMNGKKKEVMKFKRSIASISPFDIVILNQRVDEVVEKLTDATIECTCKDKAEELLRQIINSSKAINDENSLHHIRIMLRELIYILNIIKKNHKGFKYSKLFISELDDLQLKLGNWHDLKILLEDIGKFDCANRASALLQAIAIDKQLTQNDIIYDLSKLQTK